MLTLIVTLPLLALTAFTSLRTKCRESRIDSLVRLHQSSFSCPQDLYNSISKCIFSDPHGPAKMTKSDMKLIGRIIFSKSFERVPPSKRLAKVITFTLYHCRGHFKISNPPHFPEQALRTLFTMYPQDFVYQISLCSKFTIDSADMLIKLAEHSILYPLQSYSDPHDSDVVIRRASFLLYSLLFDADIQIPEHLWRVGDDRLDSALSQLRTLPTREDRWSTFMCTISAPSFPQQSRIEIGSYFDWLQNCTVKQSRWISGYYDPLPAVDPKSMCAFLRRYNHSIDDAFIEYTTLRANSTMCLPSDVLIHCASFVDDILTLNDFICSCRSLYQNDHLRNIFRERVQMEGPRFIVKAVHLFDEENARFMGSWSGRPAAEIFALICKVILALKTKSNLTRFAQISDDYLWPFITGADTEFATMAATLFSFMLAKHKFESRKQFEQFSRFELVQKEFSECLQNPSCCSPHSIEPKNALLVFECILQENRHSIEIILSHFDFLADASISLRLAAWGEEEVLANRYPSKSIYEIVFANLYQIESDCSEQFLCNLAIVIVNGIIKEGRRLPSQCPKRLRKHVVEYLYTVRFPENVMRRVMNAILYAYRSVDQLALDMISLNPWLNVTSTLHHS